MAPTRRKQAPRRTASPVDRTGSTSPLSSPTASARARVYYPIVYVRGYAGTQNEVEDTVDDPFYGFNKGSTHIRVGMHGDPQFFAFESALVRLMSDHGYCDVFEGDRQKIMLERMENTAKSIWIYRYYDQTSQTFKDSTGTRLSIEEAALGLRSLIETIHAETNTDKVNLVAHSMGGLICRSLIQKIYPEHGERGIDHVHKFFTYGTPHGGIHFHIGGGVIEWIRDRVGWNNADDFGRQRMYEYLTPHVKKGATVPDDFVQNDLRQAFPTDRVFCVVGTNARDYDVAFGLSRRTVGPQSDGLVQIDHAYVKGSHRAYLNRSHSGRYGMVNSEEGYQNLQRFLFGDIKVHVALEGVHHPATPVRKQEGVTRQDFYQAEVQIAIRNLPSLVHEQTLAHYCPLLLTEGHRQGHYPLYTAFLMPSNSTAPDRRTCRYAVGLRVFRLSEADKKFSFRGHLEQVPSWSDWLILDVKELDSSDRPYSAHYIWSSQGRDPSMPVEDSRIRVPESAQAILGPNAVISFHFERWT